ncbi:MAG: radical SAM protein, partial [Tannerella sp.]|nr:radical SAM protein [Tannerella sp.]
MKKSIVLVSANIYHIPYPVYPLGISYLVSYLSIHLPEYEIKTFDFNLESYDSFAGFLRNHELCLVGLSLRNFDDSTHLYEKNIFISHYKEIMRIARENTKAPIVLGGSGFAVFPELVFNELQPDYAIKGEGEASLKELILTLENSSSPLDIDGLAYRQPDGTFHINGRTKYISSPVLHVENDWCDYYWKKSGMLNIQTKRGCPYNCIYCSYPLIDGRKVRTLDAQAVVNNIEELYFSKGISYLFFTDSIFNIHKEYNRELANRLIESKADIQWGAYFSPSQMTLDDLKLYQKSGLTHIEFGTDSLSDGQLENYNKNFRFADIREQSQNCGNLGIFYAHFLILGGYGETDESLDETFERSKELGLTIYFPYIGMRVYPETQLCEIALEEGIIRSPNELINPVYYVSKQITAETIVSRAKATGQQWVFPD